MAHLDNSDLEIIKAASLNANIFTEYYFGITLMDHQLAAIHAKQNSVLTLGGRGSGKTFGYAVGYMYLCAMIPDFRVLWVSNTSDQAAIGFFDIVRPLIMSSPRFHRFLPEGLKSLKKRPYPQVNIRIPGLDVPESSIVFRTAGDGGDSNRGSTVDAIHIDEGGLIYDDRVVTTLRPNMRGERYDGTPRLGRMTVSTTPTAAEWLRHWWESARNSEYAGYNPADYFAVKVRSDTNTHLTAEQLKAFRQDMTPEEMQVEIEADFPEYYGNEFSPKLINDCQNNDLNRELEEMIANGQPGADLMKVGRVGTLIYQKPVEEGHSYILSGDPGTGNPPFRNAGVIVVIDVTQKPYELVYFHWVGGDGDYRPFFRHYTWAYEYYKPSFSVFDATGTQRAMDQLYFEEKDIYVEGLSVTNEKPAMINNMKIIIQRGLFTMPFIEGLRLQLLNYRQDKDKKIPQDIVMCLMMAFWKMRALNYAEAEDLPRGGEYPDMNERAIVSNRFNRDADRASGR